MMRFPRTSEDTLKQTVFLSPLFQSRAKCSASHATLASNLGERLTEKTMKAFSGGKGKMGDPTLGEEKWTESFQDLGSWCPPHQDELNTPEFTMQDEFNFGNDGNVGERQVIEYTLDSVSPQVDMQCDQWGATPDPLFIQPPFMLEEENNNSVGTITEMPNNMCSSYSQGKRLINPTSSQMVMQQPSPIRLNGNLMLSQYTFEAPQEDQESKYSALNTDKNVILGDTYEKLNSSSLSSSTTPLSSISPLKSSSMPPVTQPVTVIKVKPPGPSSFSQKGVGSSYINPNMRQSFKVPSPGVNGGMRRDRPRLEPLNIESAVSKKISCLDTPEVLQPLNEASNFNLLDYVCGTSEGSAYTAEEVSSPLLDESLTIKEEEQPIRPDPEVIQSDHDYTEPHFMDFPSTVKEEPLSPRPDSYSYDSPASYTNQKRSKKRKSDSSDDYIYDTENLSDESMDWAPSKSKKKTKTGKRRNSKSGGKGGVTVAAKIERRTSFSRLTVDSETESILSSADRYRELRDRNNEASRRSRLNRKQKEMEMNDEAEGLSRRNIHLTAKAKKLENLVGIMRKLVMAKVTALGKG